MDSHKRGVAARGESVVGMNGRLWLRARSVKETLCLTQAVESSEHMNRQEVQDMCSSLQGILQAFG